MLTRTALPGGSIQQHLLPALLKTPPPPGSASPSLDWDTTSVVFPEILSLPSHTQKMPLVFFLFFLIFIYLFIYLRDFAVGKE